MSHAFKTCPSCGALNRIDPARAAESGARCGSCKAAVSGDVHISEVSAVQLEHLVRVSPVPVVVDFWAAWCGPCRAFAPAFAQVARELAGSAVFAKLDTEAHGAASVKYGVRGIPTLMVFKGGTEKVRQSGAMPAAVFRQWLAPHLS